MKSFFFSFLYGKFFIILEYSLFTLKLDLHEIGQLTFEDPDTERFPALRLAREALDAGGAASTILNAANEVAVRRFLDGEIGFLDIFQVFFDYFVMTAPCFREKMIFLSHFGMN